MQVPRNSHRKPPDLLRGSRRNGILVVQRSEEEGVRTGQDPIFPLRSDSVSSKISVVKRLSFLANGKGWVQIVVV
jgi:hypothetical protein